MEKILPPSQCPSCDEDLVLKGDILYCTNRQCPAQISKKLENHLKVLKIKGLGPALISKIPVNNLSEFYNLHGEELAELIGSTTIAIKVMTQITNLQKSQLPFATFLASLSIPKFGLAVSKKLAKIASSLEDLLDEDIVTKANLGPKKTEILLNWVESENFEDALVVESLYNIINTEETKKLAANVCITGKLENYKNRQEAATFLESKGITVTTGVSSKTNYLIADNISSSSKFVKAKQLSIPIVSMNEFIKLVENNEVK